ncbi:hypothetical protein LK429_13225 [Hoylesella buccalis]|uniref:hypothetical protein n=1 Tax=Hoylesella buccalis TaxID=28127 RepID=UPI001D075473|nr:hypothetical protein [Hoylesella buccalis]MCB6903020.1 hypothetical protein [Hoylesella buccalis]UEA62957.1 hypothetical protein LK429_13225 [Hoylesella buccalis]UWP49755.1 hypothetical protein NQ518_01410 [Hoylesella buccalis ATCC 35310]
MSDFGGCYIETFSVDKNYGRLGNILSVMDENGAKVFDASYDAWGRQTVTINTMGLHRGYTGHRR